MEIRLMTAEDKSAVKEMMRVFYSSPAVLTNGSDEIFENDLEACVSDNPYAEAYVFTEGDNIVGYSMLARSFSTEFGRPCVWIEDLYFNESSRGRGYGSAFFDFLKQKYPQAVFRLEVEDENTRAKAVYTKNGFKELPYQEMIIV